MHGVTSKQVMFSNVGHDLIITITTTQEKITVYGQLLDDTQPLIRTIYFDDGSTINYKDFLQNIRVGTPQDDIIHAEMVSEKLFGNAGDDVLFAQHGDDILDGGAGNDILVGGKGYDIYVFSIGYGHDTIVEAPLSGNSSKILVKGLTYQDLAFSHGDNGTNVLSIIATSESIRFVGTIQMEIEGRGTYSIGNSTTLAYNLLDGPLEPYQSHTFYGTQNNDILNGLNADDVLIAGAGDDILDGGLGNDTLIGGYGNDTYKLYKNAGNDIVVEGLWGNNINRLFSFDAIDATTIKQKEINFNHSATGMLLSINNTNDSINYINGNQKRLSEIKLADAIITVNSETSTITTIDRIGATIYGFNDTSAIYGSYGSDQLHAGKHSATLDGGQGNDFLYGNTESDNLIGGQGDDRLDAGQGYDKLLGGYGSDTFIFAKGSDHDFIVDGHYIGGSKLEGDVDTLELKGLLVTDVSFSRKDYGELTISINETGESIVIHQQYAESLYSDDAIINKFIFADGTVLSANQVYNLAVFQTTVYDGFISGFINYGTDFNDAFNYLSSYYALREGSLVINYSGNNADRFYINGGLGDDNYWLSSGYDNYNVYRNPTQNTTLIFDQNFGHDRVRFNEDLNPENNSIYFSCLSKNEVIISRDGDNLLITAIETGDSVFIEKQYTESYNLLFDKIYFSNGEVFDEQDFYSVLLPRGTAGNDSLTDMFGDDDIYGLAGNDKITSRNGNDKIYGGDGDDQLYISGNLIRSTILDGSNGNDSLYAGSGNDTLFGGDGDDLLSGDNGNDHISAGGGFDRLFGGIGDDQLYGEGGTDSLYAGSGADTLFGGEGSDSLYAASGNDTLFGGEGNDDLYAGSGIDKLYGGSGSDELYGEDGNDTYEFEGNFGRDFISLGGEGGNIIIFKDLNLEDIIVTRGWNYISIQSNAADDSVKIANGSTSYSPTFLFQNDRIIFQDGTTISLNELLNKLKIQTDGDDYIVVDNGDDFIEAGLGNDAIFSGQGNDTLVFRTGFGQDVILSNGLSKSEGSNTIYLPDFIASDIHIISAPSKYNYGYGNGEDRIYISVVGQEDRIEVGKDQIDFILFGDGTRYDHAQIVQLIPLAPNEENVSTDGDDRIIVARNDYSFRGGLGSDTFVVAEFNGQYNIADRYYQKQETDFDVLELTQYERTDVQLFNIDNYMLEIRTVANNQSLYIYGQFQWPDLYIIDEIRFKDGQKLTRQEIYDNAINPYITGTSGDDSFISGISNEIFNLTDGNDQYIFGANFGEDYMSASSSAGLIGNTVINLTVFQSEQIAFSSSWTSSLEVLVIETGDTISISGQFGAELGEYAIDQFLFADQTLTGQQIRELLLKQTDGDDQIRDFMGNDRLFGGLGNDRLISANGDDTLIGGQGDDQLLVGDGNKTIIFDAESGHDFVRYYFDYSYPYQKDVPIDLIFTNLRYQDIDIYSVKGGMKIVSLVSDASLTFSNSSLMLDHVRFKFLDNMEWVKAGDLRAKIHGTVSSDYIVGEAYVNELIYGGDGDDIIHGQNDIIYGGAGDDTLYNNYGIDGKTIFIGGAGNDIFVGSRNDIYQYDDVIGYDKIDGGAYTSDIGTIKFNLLNKDDVIFALNSSTSVSADYGSNPYYVCLNIIVKATGEMISIDSNHSMYKPYTYQDMISYIPSVSIIFANGETMSFEKIKEHILYSNSDLNDLIDGTSGEDYLDGGRGSDILFGGLGDDTYFTDVITDVAVERPDQGLDHVISQSDYTLRDYVENLTLASDTIAVHGSGNALDNLIKGNQNNNFLEGMAGNDTLDGGLGADTMRGGLGDDTYFTDVITDVAVERPDQGLDHVISQSDYTLGDYVENLTLASDTIAVHGLGNALDNVLKGNQNNNLLEGMAGNDTLDGGLGADTMRGGLGDDYYYVNDVEDQIIEQASEGNDTVYSDITITASENVENIILVGNHATNATGNVLNNTLIGNSADNVLSGGIGQDTLIGGLGNDTYFYTRDSGHDVLIDYSTVLTVDVNTVYFEAGMTRNRLIVEWDNDDLMVSITGHTAQLRIQNFKTDQNEWRFILGDGVNLTRTKIIEYIDKNLDGYPIVADDQVSLFANNKDVSGNVLTNDQDPANLVLFISNTSIQEGLYGTLHLSTDGNYQYILDPNKATFLGADEHTTEAFSYIANNGDFESIGQLIVKLTGINDAPITDTDTNSLLSNEQHVTGNVLENDTDPDSDRLTIVNQNQFEGSYGTLHLYSDGRYEYLLDNSKTTALKTGEEVTDLFNYQVTDGLLNTASQLIIHIVGANVELSLDIIACRNGSATIQGLTEANASVSIMAPNGQVYTVTADSIGNYTYNISSVAAQGIYTARATDVYGNTSSAVTLDFIDNVAPNISIEMTAYANGSATIQGLTEANASVSIMAPNGQVYTVTTDSIGNYTYNISSVAAQGIYTAHATDVYGNTSSAVTLDFIDNVAPEVSLDVFAQQDGTAKLQGVTEANATVNIHIANGQSYTVKAGTSGIYSLTVDSVALQGTYTAQATDIYGNSSSVVTVDFIDRVAPEVSLDVFAQQDGTAKLQGVTEANATVNIHTANGQSYTVKAGTNGIYSLTVDSVALQGTYTAQATDIYGNSSSVVTVDFIDRVAPEVSLEVIAQKDGTAKLQGVTEANATVNIHTANGQSYTVKAGTNGIYSLMVDSVALQGTYTAQATDIYGNSSSLVSVDFIDRVAPEKISLDTYKIVANTLQIMGYSEPNSTVNIYTQTGEVIGTFMTNTVGKFVAVIPQTYNNGKTLNLTATDAAGNQSQPIEFATDPVITFDNYNHVSINSVSPIAATSFEQSKIFFKLFSSSLSSVMRIGSFNHAMEFSIQDGHLQNIVATVKSKSLAAILDQMLVSLYKKQINGSWQLISSNKDQGCLDFIIFGEQATINANGLDSGNYKLGFESKPFFGLVNFLDVSLKHIDYDLTQPLKTNSTGIKQIAGNVVTDEDQFTGSIDHLGPDNNAKISILKNGQFHDVINLIQVQGKYGLITFFENGDYVYQPTSLSKQVNFDEFSYKITNSNGDSSIAKLLIDFAYNWTGSTAEDLFVSSGANDCIVGNLGADTLVYQLLVETDKTGGNANDSWSDFNLGNVNSNLNADKIDVSDLILNYSGDQSSVSLTPYLNTFLKDGNTELYIDRDGKGLNYDYSLLLTLNNINTNLSDLIINQQLIV